jgi:hypothetical protein
VRVQLNVVAGGQREAHALAGFQQLAGRNALGGDTVGVEILFQLGQGRIAIDLEGEEIDTGGIGLAQDHAVVIALFPGLEINAALGIATGFDQTQHLGIEINAFFNVEHPHLSVSGTKYTCHCHVCLLFCDDRKNLCNRFTVTIFTTNLEVNNFSRDF